MDTLQFSGPPEDYLVDQGRYRCLSSVPRVEVETDGMDHKVIGHRSDTLAVQIVDRRLVKFSMKKAG